jgi:hypothetical protein
MSAEKHVQLRDKGRETLTRNTITVTDGDTVLLEQLVATHREILLAKGNYKEMGLNLRLSAGTVKSRLHRARAALLRLREENLAPVH